MKYSDLYNNNNLKITSWKDDLQLTYSPTYFLHSRFDINLNKWRYFVHHNLFNEMATFKNDDEYIEITPYKVIKYFLDREINICHIQDIMKKDNSITLSKLVIDWIKEYFDKTNNCNAIIGISGGKDSTVVAALCKEALGADRVIGVMMPNGIQKDMDDSKRIINFLGIKKASIDITEIYNLYNNKMFNTDVIGAKVGLSNQTKLNLAPRIRMTLLYGLAQSLNGRVVGTSNLCERKIGWSTLWGDSVSDINPIADLTVSDVIQVGDELGLPYDLVHKIPADGLTDKSDEDNLGFTYSELEDVFAKKLSNDNIENRIKNYSWKSKMTNIPFMKWRSSFYQV